MNKKVRNLIIQITAILGASCAAMSIAILSGFKSVFITILFCTIAGTITHILFTFLTTQITNLLFKKSLTEPGKKIYWLNKLPPEEFSSAGGKARALAVLIQSGLPIPRGFVILPNAYAQDEISDDMQKIIINHVAKLRKNKNTMKFAVRSSALAEDSAQASFAGEFESVLNVSTNEEIFKAIHDVHQSLYSDRVAAYREAQALTNDKQDIGIIVQEQINADFAGVLFTADPINGDLNSMQGNFTTGLGDKLVSGEVSAEVFTFQRPGGAYTGSNALSKSSKKLYKLAWEIEREFGLPQDIEWAIVDKKVFILQSRPITTLQGFNPATGVWNDALLGNFLWSATNLSEAYPFAQTTFSASTRPYLEKHGGPNLIVKGYPLNGTIAGRFYANLRYHLNKAGQTKKN
ncbi:MAG: hypothetical protein JEZ00_22250 [Anaerolineaceae bacterium]|nr:hypothetical protein [Anaerolineaceae bacterium]